MGFSQNSACHRNIWNRAWRDSTCAWKLGYQVNALIIPLPRAYSWSMRHSSSTLKIFGLGAALASTPIRTEPFPLSTKLRIILEDLAGRNKELWGRLQTTQLVELLGNILRSLKVEGYSLFFLFRGTICLWNCGSAKSEHQKYLFREVSIWYRFCN